MNARNLKYIKKFNPKKAIRLADNKLKTKKFLSLRGIPVPETYGVIDSRKALFDFDRNSLPEKEFVVKPNKGSK
jgi:glutathione synthase/RimK-type ligase-like ATP-grasp enzyme